jgi:hypothetical protein
MLEEGPTMGKVGLYSEPRACIRVTLHLILMIVLLGTGRWIQAQEQSDTVMRRGLILLLDRPQDREVERLFQGIIAQSIRWNLERKNLGVIEKNSPSYSADGTADPLQLLDSEERNGADFVLLSEYASRGTELEVRMVWYEPQSGELLQEVTRRGRKDLVLDKMIREVVTELLVAVEPTLEHLPLRELPAGEQMFQPVTAGTVSGGASSPDTVNGHAPQLLPSGNESTTRPTVPTEPPSGDSSAEGGSIEGTDPSGGAAKPKHFEIALGCGPFVTTGAASEYFKLGILPSLSVSYLIQGKLMRLGLGLYGGVNLFTASGTVATAENVVVPMGVILRYEIGNERSPSVQFGISSGPAMFIMNSTASGKLMGLTFYGRGSLGVRLPLGSTLGITIEAGYDVYWEQPSPIMGFSPSVVTAIRL